MSGLEFEGLASKNQPNILKERLEHYHDTGEHAFNRGLKEYKSMIFIDSSDLWLKEKPKEMTPENSMQWSMRHFHVLKHFIPKQLENQIIPTKDESCGYEWDLKEGEIFGGIKGFFISDSNVLDLGSGSGKAVKEINNEFKTKNIKCVGIDHRYFEKKPDDAENLFAGDFENLPFDDESFDRILSVESFPCWLPNDEKLIDRYIEEITRVSKLGTIWRGTFATYDFEDKVIFSTDQIMEKFTKSGWEVFAHNNSFSAKLIYKHI